MFKKIFRKLRKVAGDAAPIIGALTGNPLLAAGIGAFASEDPVKSALLGAAGGFGGKAFGMGGGGAGLGSFDLGKIFGNAGTMASNFFRGPLTTTAPGQANQYGQSGLESLLGGIEKAAGSNIGKLAIPAALSFITQRALQKDIDEPADINAYRSLIDEKYGDITGGSPFAKDRIRGTKYNPEDGKYYDMIKDGEYKNFEVDEEGKITNLKSGGITKLNMGGNPFMQRNRVKGNFGIRRLNKGGDGKGIATYFPRKFGMIRGPGGPKDDKIPAMLSNGEFVFTAKAVDNLGGPRAMYNLMNKADPESSKGRGII